MADERKHRAFRERYGPTALVAGASEGLGAAYAQALASRGLDLVLVARRPEQLGAEASFLRNKYGVSVREISCDLADPEATEAIIKGTTDLTIGCLVYNAAASHIGSFLSADTDACDKIISVNINSPLHLVHHFGKSMVERGKGGVVLMSSLAGLQGAGFLALYGATKAFNHILAESLWYEWKSNGVDVITCMAGATATPNYWKTRPSKAHFLAPTPEEPSAVAEGCLRRLGKSPSYVSGFGNRVVSFLMQHLMPRKSAITMMGSAMRNSYHFEE